MPYNTNGNGGGQPQDGGDQRAAWSDVNVVVAIGRLGNIPELRYTNSGTAVINVSIAVNGRPRDGQTITHWLEVLVWGNSAEYIAAYAGKGDKISVKGHLSTQEWEDKNTGQHRSKMLIEAEEVQFQESKEARETRQKNRYARESQGQGQGGYQNTQSDQAPNGTGNGRVGHRQGNVPRQEDFQDHYYDNTGFDPTPVDFDENSQEQGTGVPNRSYGYKQQAQGQPPRQGQGQQNRGQGNYQRRGNRLQTPQIPDDGVPF